MYTQIIKIIEGGLIGDKEKVYNYAKMLSENIKKEGDEKLSKKILDVLQSKKNGLVGLDEFNTKPVDQESRMDIVTITFPTNNFEHYILNSQIEEEIDDFIKIFKYREKMLSLGIDDVSSLLLYGPPGCGKTTLAQYISYKTGLPLVTARLDALVSSLLGSTSKNIRKVFEYASKRECILFLDEFDVIAKVRDDKNELGELKRVVNSLIQNIDQFSSNSLLIAATNHEELLDSAIWRRFSKVISLGGPNKDEIKLMVMSQYKEIKNNFIDNSKRIKNIVDALDGLSHSDIKLIINTTIRKVIIHEKDEITHLDVLKEIYLFRNHNVINEEEFIKFLIQYGALQTEINSIFNIPLRKIRGLSNK